MTIGKLWRLGLLALVAGVFVAAVLAPIPGPEIVVRMPAPGQPAEPEDLWLALGLGLLGLALVVLPPVVLIWLALRVVRRGRFLGR